MREIPSWKWDGHFEIIVLENAFRVCIPTPPHTVRFDGLRSCVFVRYGCDVSFSLAGQPQHKNGVVSVGYVATSILSSGWNVLSNRGCLLSREMLIGKQWQTVSVKVNCKQHFWSEATRNSYMDLLPCYFLISRVFVPIFVAAVHFKVECKQMVLIHKDRMTWHSNSHYAATQVFRDISALEKCWWDCEKRNAV